LYGRWNSMLWTPDFGRLFGQNLLTTDTIMLSIFSFLEGSKFSDSPTIGTHYDACTWRPISFQFTAIKSHSGGFRNGQREGRHAFPFVNWQCRYSMTASRLRSIYFLTMYISNARLRTRDPVKTRRRSLADMEDTFRQHANTKEENRYS